MDLHNRYLHFPTLEISVLQTADSRSEDNVFVTLRRLIQFYNSEMTRQKLDMSKLEIFRMLLCYEYQLVFNSIEKCNNGQYIMSDAKKICFPGIEAVFPARYSRSTEEISVLHDIIVLQLALYCDNKTIKRHLQNFLNLRNDYTKSSDTRIMYMKVLEYVLESICLYQFLHNESDESKEVLKEIGLMYLEIMKLWVKIKEDLEWGLFASIFPTLMNTFAPEHILFPLWDYILNEMNDLKERLTVLSVMMDNCFATSRSIQPTYIHLNVFSDNAFWLLILEGLRSPLQQYRKQALYIMKRAIDSMNETCNQNLEVVKAPITPFICNKTVDSALPIDSVRQKFFLIYEALEEKQHHLVIPALTHVTSLIRANKEHELCNGCFNIVWLQCILEKILQHENNNIAKLGILYTCKLDETIFNDRFLELFVNILNNTSLYECQPNEDYPEIVRELLVLFGSTGKKKEGLLNRFLMKVSGITWGPVAIFYVMLMLRTISDNRDVHNNWQAAELNAVKSLVETNLNIHSHVLRTASQTELVRSVPNYVPKVDDLSLLANVLAAFSSGDGLARGTFSWDVITAWLRKLLAKEDAATFVEDICAQYLREDADPELNLRTFALMIFLLRDANLILSCKVCSAEKALNNWLCLLNGINVRPYADIRPSIDIVEFISHLLNFSTRIEPCDSTIRLISLYIHIAFKFLIKNVRKMATEISYEDYTRYVAIVSSYIVNANLFMLKKDVDNYAEELQNESIRLLMHTQRCQSMQYLYGLHMLHISQSILVSPLAKTFYTEHLLNIQAIPVCNVNNNADSVNLKGKIASEYYFLLGKLIYQYLRNSPVHSWTHTATLLSSLLKLFELEAIEIVSEVATILTIIVDNKVIKDVDDRGTFEHVFQLCWRCIFASKKNNIFWRAVQELTGVIVNNNFLLLPNAAEYITKFVDQLIEEGECTPRLRRILLSKMERLDVRNLVKLGKPLLYCLLHGSIVRRDKRIENQTHLFIARHLGQYFQKHIFILDHNNDTAIRALASVLLHRIIVHPELNYAVMVVPLIVEMLEKYKNKRYFNDSYLHKLKQRLMQVLLILEPVLNEEFAALLEEKLRNSIFSESNQPSVRLMQEWLMARIFKRNINLRNKLWKFYAESIEERPGCTISVASIVYHVAQLLSSNDQIDFIRTALPYIAQCCLGQHFNMRLYNQFILIQLYELLEKANDDETMSRYKGIYQAAIASLQQRSSVKNSTKIQDHFYFSNFHPINDYSLQTIYYELPRLTNVNCDEWINPDVFETFTFEQNNNHPLLLYNIDSSLSDTTASMYLTKSVTDDTESSVNHVETYFEGLHNIQKKIDPSKSTVPLYSEIFEAMKESIHQRDLQLHEGLIVVASFVSRPPNLGGITRTCEIFGVKALVIANLDHIKDKEFQCLSVSAERWINILQVKPHELQEYLLEKKNAGWSLVGVEQTANSTSLLKTEFQKKTILVLGNEKNGIPANFIPLFDVCIEIPQMGIIRSLNVHVSAAICIWQYASQYMLK